MPDIMKPEKDEDDEEEELTPEEKTVLNALSKNKNLLSVGDIVLSSNNCSMSDLTKQCVGMLKNKTIKSYLGVHNKKKLLGGSFGIG